MTWFRIRIKYSKMQRLPWLRAFLFRVFDVQMKPTPLPCRSIYGALQFQESYYKGVRIKTSFYAFRLGEASITREARGLKIRAAAWCEWVYGRTWRQKKSHQDLRWFQTPDFLLNHVHSQIFHQKSQRRIMKIRLFSVLLLFLFSSFRSLYTLQLLFLLRIIKTTYSFIYIFDLGLMSLSFSTNRLNKVRILFHPHLFFFFFFFFLKYVHPLLSVSFLWQHGELKRSCLLTLFFSLTLMSPNLLVFLINGVQ